MQGSLGLRSGGGRRRGETGVPFADRLKGGLWKGKELWESLGKAGRLQI